MQTDFRIARPLAARLLGAGLVAGALAVMVGTLVAAAVGSPVQWVLAGAGVVIVAVLLTGIWVARGWAVLRLTDDGYRVRLWRPAGVRAARWEDVSEALTSYAGDEPVVVLQLLDGRRTVLPVRLLDADREELVRTLQEHLQRGHGLRRL